MSVAFTFLRHRLYAALLLSFAIQVVYTDRFVDDTIRRASISYTNHTITPSQEPRTNITDTHPIPALKAHPPPPQRQITHFENTRFCEPGESPSPSPPSSSTLPGDLGGLALPALLLLRRAGSLNAAGRFSPTQGEDDDNDDDENAFFPETLLPCTSAQQEGLLPGCFLAPVPKRQAARSSSQSIVSRWLRSSRVAISASTLPESMPSDKQYTSRV